MIFLAILAIIKIYFSYNILRGCDFIKVKATEIKNNLGEYLRICAREDVIITKHNREIAVLKGIEEGIIIKEEADSYETSNKMTYPEFIEFTKNTDDRYELINGELYLLASPKVIHQKISANIYGHMFKWFEEKKCEPFFAPFDITLKQLRKNPDVVQPDIVVICDLQDHMNESGYYMGTPSLVVEILSPSSRSRDMILKLDLYMTSGIKEYWIVNPMNGEITVYLFENNNIKDNKTYSSNMSCTSFIFPEFSIDLHEIFNV